jgi:hypothetical protein
MAKIPDPRKKPILSVLVENPRLKSRGASASIRIAFRYWSAEKDRLQHYESYDYPIAKFAFDNFYLKHVVWGHRPELENDDRGCPWIRYEGCHHLEDEKHLRAMARTLSYFNSKLKPMQWREPQPRFSQYVKEAAELFKIEEAVLNDSEPKISLEDALNYIENVLWKMRQRCLILENNLSVEEYVRRWCDRHEYTQLQKLDGWWAVPPNQLVPICIDRFLKL